ncbi:MAG: superoxide dismutase [Piscirickettsiaceae bacterium CG_4_9_14_3_um_filter_43_564]|nr:superoxide dismutase [Thiomicrospira sp.]OIP93731.1 MAG: superoxide dismutase [Thiomicrospira sp. CG2_30_44_34]PIQ02711.1 MAG: superoxide dismutase [Piscirickettsiaceae bacterium CG18_big_fil_WC_8_21_14_2_50_44_103]PIU38841.1 MAG: superoxide dismutase [Piscirickettsiaceae bacterium CG07_land_8_20_14_0_80_44_28]PIW58018.1 MAG: superoxide dismutase [Piscirickettsiaceae bacterium CG12_big_fil_rev_8_21_14_0_65_44_934]PIW78024.1 MAG: superoxide dismutase [Piscirickettsiaceae bacterium CG_4_8_14_
MAFTLPDLPYDYDALEVSIDARTMEIHHTKHHNTYITNLNNAVADTPNADKSLSELITNAGQLSPAIRNNGGGHWNHSFFWEVMTGDSMGTPTGALADDINATFGSLEAMKEQFNTAGATRFGSGWAWLTISAEGKLEISSTPNQDNPLMDVADVKGTPILGLDVWEHAYYLRYQNLRPAYMQAWWDVVNWNKVSELYTAAKA